MNTSYLKRKKAPTRWSAPCLNFALDEDVGRLGPSFSFSAINDVGDTVWSDFFKLSLKLDECHIDRTLSPRQSELFQGIPDLRSVHGITFPFRDSAKGNCLGFGERDSFALTDGYTFLPDVEGISTVTDLLDSSRILERERSIHEEPP